MSHPKPKTNRKPKTKLKPKNVTDQQQQDRPTGNATVQDHNNNTTKKDKPGSTTATARGPQSVAGIKRRIRRLKPAQLAKIFAALAPQDQPDAASAESLQWLFKKFGSDEAGVRAAMRELSAQGDDVLSLASLVGWAKHV